MSDLTPWCICCGRTTAICKRDKGCSKIDPTVRRSFYQPYYDGGVRVVVDSVPCRLSAIVEAFSPWMKRQLLRGELSRKEQQEAKSQFAMLMGCAR